MIVITNYYPLLNEAYLLNRLFDEGLELLHIRKPGISENELISFIQKIKQENRNKLVLHHNYDLGERFDINRIHFAEKNRPDFQHIIDRLGSEKSWIFSASTHSIDDFNNLPDVFEYAFLSPVYESISKPGYMSDYNIIESVKKRANFKTKLIALGGINKDNCRQILNSGFDDIALLGAVWNAEDPIAEFKKCNNEK